MEVDTVDTCKEMVLNGLGYAIMPEMIVNGYDNIHKVIMTDKARNPLMRKTWLVYEADLLAMNTVRSFVEFLKFPESNGTM